MFQLINRFRTIPTNTLFDASLFGLITAYFVVSHRPELSTDSLGMPSHSDKLIHFLVYAAITGTFLFRAAHRGGGILVSSNIVPSTLIWLVFISVFDEFSQPLTGRTFDWLDLFADWSAIALVVLTLPPAFRWIASLACRQRENITTS